MEHYAAQPHVLFAYWYSRIFPNLNTCFCQTNLICQLRPDPALERASTASRSAFQDHGEQAFKGISEPVRLWAVVEGGA